MNHLDHRRYLLALSNQMLKNEPLTDKQYIFLGLALRRIGLGEDANKVLSVSRQRGQSDSNALARQKLSFVMHWVACAIVPVDAKLPGFGYTIEKACEEAVTIARNVFEVANSEKYDAAYIRKCWYSTEYAHMRAPHRSHFDQDSPF